MLGTRAFNFLSLIIVCSLLLWAIFLPQVRDDILFLITIVLFVIINIANNIISYYKTMGNTRLNKKLILKALTIMFIFVDIQLFVILFMQDIKVDFAMNLGQWPKYVAYVISVILFFSMMYHKRMSGKQNGL